MCTNLSGLVKLLSEEFFLHSRVPGSWDVLSVLPSSVVPSSSSSSSSTVGGRSGGRTPTAVLSRRGGREPSRGSSESSSGGRGSGPAVRGTRVEQRARLREERSEGELRICHHSKGRSGKHKQRKETKLSLRRSSGSRSRSSSLTPHVGRDIGRPGRVQRCGRGNSSVS